MSINAATLFSGIGAPELAMPRWNWKWAAETDDFASAVYQYRHGVPNLGDVTAKDFAERANAIASVDVIIGGSPCQAFSVQGKRLGFDDPRGAMAFRFFELVRDLRPRWFVLENVAGLLTHDIGRSFRILLQTIEECGYYGAWRIFDSAYAGVPQRRRRIFVIGYLGDWRGPATVLFEPRSLSEYSFARYSCRKTTAAFVDGCADKPIAINMRGRSVGVMPEPCEFASVRAAAGGGSRSYFVHSHCNSNILRRMTPLEAERLQGFPDNFSRIPFRGRSAEDCFDTLRFRVIGNSMTVPVMKWILDRIERVDGFLQA